MSNAVIYIHGKGGSAAEAAHYQPLFPNSAVLGFDYKAETPWDAKGEFSQYLDAVCRKYDTVWVITNSIGAYFLMNARINEKITRAFFISPIVDMEKLIADMMIWANVTEEELHRRKEIATDFGETLSWAYLCYVRENSIRWEVPTHILYGGQDNLTSADTMTAFARSIGASLDIMQDGGHWFHTEAQMAYLDQWIRRNA